jgi:hypothetical protein
MRRSVVGAALMLLLAGCGGDPKADPPPSTSPTPSVSSTPSPPALPEAAKANTKAGAIAFVRYYVALLNLLQSTGDERPLLAVSQSNCRSCMAVVRAANAIYDSGGHVEGGLWTIRKAEVEHPAPAAWTVRISGQLAPSRVIEAGATSPKPGTGGDADAEFVLTFRDSWEVVQWQTL